MNETELKDYVRGLLEAILKDGTSKDLTEVYEYLADKDLEIINREDK